MVIYVYKDKEKTYEYLKSGKIIKDNKFKEEYSYDFIPNLENWLDIDEQRKNAKRLEDISKGE